MAIRRTLAEFSDEIVAADIAANAVGASELADDAVDTAAIATNAVTATEIVAGAITEAKLNADVTDGSAITTSVKSHIIPGVLYPAVAGKGIDGTTTVTSFGTDFAISGYATLKYYYTDIKGSKPIKDPRIGAHFGSQRHTFRSAQLLTQETATYGRNVYSVDGREWLRAVGNFESANAPANNDYGVYFYSHTEQCFFEIVGYFSEANIICMTQTGGTRGIKIQVDGGTESSEIDDFSTTVT